MTYRTLRDGSYAALRTLLRADGLDEDAQLKATPEL